MRRITTSIAASLQVIENLPLYLKASYAREGSASKDYALNRCLSHIERLNRVSSVKSKKGAIARAWEVYFELQGFLGDERQDYNPYREIPLDTTPKKDLHSEEATSTAVAFESEGPNVYSGGLGYKHVNWDSSHLMAAAKRRESDPFLNNKAASEVRPIRIFTQAEIDKLNSQGR